MVSSISAHRPFVSGGAGIACRCDGAPPFPHHHFLGRRMEGRRVAWRSARRPALDLDAAALLRPPSAPRADMSAWIFTRASCRIAWISGGRVSLLSHRGGLGPPHDRRRRPPPSSNTWIPGGPRRSARSLPEADLSATPTPRGGGSTALGAARCAPRVRRGPQGLYDEEARGFSATSLAVTHRHSQVGCNQIAIAERAQPRAGRDPPCLVLRLALLDLPRADGNEQFFVNDPRRGIA